MREARLDYLGQGRGPRATGGKAIHRAWELKTNLPDKDLDELLRQIRREWSSTSSKKVGEPRRRHRYPRTLWWSLGPLKKLGRQARNIFGLAESGQATIYIPVLSFVEIAEAMRRGAFPGAPAFSRWTAQVLASSNFLAADLTADVIVEAESLYSIPERGDRLIAATAVHLGYPLITRDPPHERIRLKTIW